MRVYILTDLEGVARVEDWDPHSYGRPDADRKKAEMLRLLTAEVNAAVEGALAAGATEVLVKDGHGSGRNLDPRSLHGGARLVRPGSGRDWLHGLTPSIDALTFVGQHAMEGTSNAVLAHSWSARRPRRCYLNGVEVGEIGAAVFLAGSLDIPAVFLAGDRAAVDEARRLVPELTGVAVKERVSPGRIRHLREEEALQRIREGMSRALSRIDAVEPPILPGPFRFREVFATPPAMGLPFLAARLLGSYGSQFVLRAMGRWSGDDQVESRIADRRTVEFRGGDLESVLRCALGRDRS